MADSDTMFDRFIFVDWSASKGSNTGKDSIWIGSCTRDNIEKISNSAFCDALACYEKGKNRGEYWNDKLNTSDNRENFLEVASVADLPTRKAAFNFLKDILSKSHRENKKTLIGFDFGFGYPHKAYGKDTIDKDWEALWNKMYTEVLSEEEEADRFKLANKWNKNKSEGGFGLFFWGRPNKTDGSLDSIEAVEGKAKARRESAEVDNFRITEKRVRWSGVKSQWQLYGAGSVGSQTLLGIPYAYALKKHLNENKINTKVWPFETEFEKGLEDDFDVLICEIHFGAIFRVQEYITRKIDALQCQNKNLNLSKEYPKDRMQVEEMCRFFVEYDKDGKVLQKFLTVDCACVSNNDRIIAQTKEGWILGVPLCLQPCDRSHQNN